MGYGYEEWYKDVQTTINALRAIAESEMMESSRIQREARIKITVLALACILLLAVNIGLLILVATK